MYSAAVVPRERVPERTERAEDARELLRLIEGKDKVAEQREDRRHHAERDGTGDDARDQ